MSSGAARPTRRDWAGLAVFVGLCLAISALAGAVTAESVGTW
jgi:hypothetical protein